MSTEELKRAPQVGLRDRACSTPADFGRRYRSAVRSAASGPEWVPYARLHAVLAPPLRGANPHATCEIARTLAACGELEADRHGIAFRAAR